MKKCLFSWKETVSFRMGWFGARFWWVKIFTWTKGGTTVCNACGPPYGFDRPIQKSKNFVFQMKKCLFSWKETVSFRMGWFGARFWWVKIFTWTKGGPQYAMHVVPPMVLTTNSKIEKLVFRMKKCLFSWKETVSFRIGMVWSTILMSENFHMDQRGDHSMQCMWSPLWFWPPIQKSRNLFFKWKNACFHERKQFRLQWDGLEQDFHEWKFNLDQRGDHSMQCMWSPLWFWPPIQKSKNLFFKWKNACFHERKQFRLEWDGLEQDFHEWKFNLDQRGDHSMQCMWSSLWFWLTNSKIEKLVFEMKKCLFSWKETVSFRMGWFGARFWWVKIFTWTKGGTTACNACGPPYGFDHQFKNRKTCFSRWKNACFHERKQFRLEWDGLEQDFDEWKFSNGPKGGPQYAMHVVPPMVLTTNSKIEKLVFQMKKCLFSWKETVSFRMGWFGARFWWVKILTWTKGGTTVCNACGPPYGFDRPIQKSKNLFFKWKNACFHERKQFRLEWDGLEHDFDEWKF